MKATGNFNVFRSSAGSGKTFTLIKEYLKLALTSPWLGNNFSPYYFKNILVVTFTNYAANEIRERILSKLSDFAELKVGQIDDMLQLIFEELKDQFPKVNFSINELMNRSSQIKDILLHNYSDFSVSTIDSFNNTIVQSFKKDLKLPYNYDLELDTSEILDKATYQLLYRLGLEKEKSLSNFLIEFALKKTDEGNSWLLDEDLKSFGENIFKESKHKIIQELKELNSKDFRDIKSELSKFTNDIEVEVKKIAQTAFNLIINDSISESALFRGKNGIYGYFKKLTLLEKSLSELTPNSFAKKTVEDNKWYASKATSADKVAIDNISNNLTTAYYKIQAIFNEYISDYIVAHSLRKTIYLLGTIKEFDKEVSAIKEEENIVHISDFNKKINQIVENEPIPYIYERIGEKYRHILIDEFQDTSQMQWHNLIPLLSHSLGERMANMIVGDAKQAIYRWRGGEPEMLVKLPEIPTASSDSVIAQSSYILKQEYNPQHLQTNYRSCQNIIKFNNLFFETTSNNLQKSYKNIKVFYKEVSQKNTSKSGGHVSFTFTGTDKEDYLQFNAQRTLDLIRKLLEQGYSKRDITILVRENKNGAFIAEQLLAHDIPVISAESLLLINSWCVKFIINLIQIINNPFQPSLKMELLNFINRELKDRNLEWTKKNNSKFKSIKDENTKHLTENYLEFQEVASNNSLEYFIEYISDKYSYNLNIVDLQLLTLYELAEEIIRVFGIGKHHNQQIYIQKLLDELLRYETRNGNNLDEFLEYWANKKEKISINSPKSGDAVNIISIHKSKGLQFKVVIMPFADWRTIPNRAILWQKWRHNNLASKLPVVILGVNKQLKQTQFSNDYLTEMEAIFIEAYNILYVAFTRAEEKLFVISKVAKESKEGEIKNVSMLFHSYINLNSTSKFKIANRILSINENESYDYEEVILYKDDLPKDNSQEAVNEDNLRINNFIHSKAALKVRMKRDDIQELENLLNINEMLSARKNGLLIHYVFEKIKYKEDISNAIKKLVNEGLLNEEEAKFQQERMEEITTLPEIRRYYQKGIGLKVRNERDLFLNEPNNTTILRPDRIVFDGDHVVIIDYKTGIEDTSKHKKQLDRYEHLIKKMGYQNISKIIVYTELVKAVVI